MKLIYIAGPYRDNRGEWFVRQNIRNAEKAAEYVWQHGGVAICPHKNTAGFGGLTGCPDEIWLAGDLEILRRCDAVWLIDGWRESTGARNEHDEAARLSIPCLFSAEMVDDFLKG